MRRVSSLSECKKGWGLWRCILPSGMALPGKRQLKESRAILISNDSDLSGTVKSKGMP
jgi:hypothetical protein